MTEEYNGHPSWEHWNVALWLGNDEGLYRTAQDYYETASRDATQAAEMFVDMAEQVGETETPDGAKYTIETVAAAIEDLFNNE